MACSHGDKGRDEKGSRCVRAGDGFALLQYRFHKASLIEFFDNAAVGMILGL